MNNFTAITLSSPAGGKKNNIHICSLHKILKSYLRVYVNTSCDCALILCVWCDFVCPCVNVHLCLYSKTDPWAVMLLSKKHYSGDYRKSQQEATHTQTMTKLRVVTQISTRSPSFIHVHKKVKKLCYWKVIQISVLSFWMTGLLPKTLCHSFCLHTHETLHLQCVFYISIQRLFS